MPLSEAFLNEQFALIEQAAIKGERCPQNYPFGPLSNNAVGALYDCGWVRAEISGRNFRQITLLVGKHKGQKTAPDPSGRPVWKTISRGRRVAKTPTPSAPRVLTREELER